MDPVDVVVVGAGLAGCSLACHLSSHVRVRILEQGDRPGAEASAHSAGMVRRMGEDPWERALAIRTAAWLDAPGDEWSAHTLSKRIGAVLGLARDPYALHSAAAHLKARGVRVEACDRPAEVAPALRGSPLVHAWYLPDERVAFPEALLGAFLGAACRRGAEVLCGVRVTGIRVEAGRVVGLDTTRGVVSTGAVVLAGGAWCGALVKGLGLHRPLVPLRRCAVRARSPRSSQLHPWVWIDDVGVWARPDVPGWLVSACEEVVDLPRPGPGSRGVVSAEDRDRILAKVTRYLPVLGPLEPTEAWSGLRTFAPDRRPVLGADPEVEGLWWAAGLGGFGVTCSWAIGEAVATWFRGLNTPWLRPAPVSPGRPFLSRWPIRPNGDVHDAELISASGRA